MMNNLHRAPPALGRKLLIFSPKLKNFSNACDAIKYTLLSYIIFFKTVSEKQTIVKTECLNIQIVAIYFVVDM